MKIDRLAGAVAVSLLVFGGIAQAITGGVDPGYVKVKVSEIRVSPNADCTGGLTIFRTDAPTYMDWVNNPTLGSGAVPNGTYRCIMVKMSDYIHYTPSTTDPSWSNGVCIPGTDYALDVAHDETAIDPDGVSQVLGAPGTEQTVWLYVREGGTASGGHTWEPTGGIPLTSPLVVTGDGSHTMVFDFSNQVSEVNYFSTWECGCEAPTMGFR